jgi:glucokinase
VKNLAIGLDVGGTKALAVLVTRDGEILSTLKNETPHVTTAGAGEATANVLIGQVRQLCDEHNLDSSLIPIGVGLPGLMRRDGHLAFAPNLKSASGADLHELIGEALGNDSVYCENDGNCAALAEHEWGAAAAIDDFVMVTLGTGIGGGVIAGGQLVRGRNGFAGEIGHMVVSARGAQCPCGGFGCWEQYASGGGLQRMTKEAALKGELPVLSDRLGGADNVRGEDVTAAAAEGLEEAVALLAEVSWWLALGLGNLVAILDAGHFVIGGGLSTASELLLPNVKAALPTLVEGFGYREEITLVTSVFGPRAGALGAALVAFERTA